jgi:hypothetical protein
MIVSGPSTILDAREEKSLDPQGCDERRSGLCPKGLLWARMIAGCCLFVSGMAQLSGSLQRTFVLCARSPGAIISAVGPGQNRPQSWRYLCEGYGILGEEIQIKRVATVQIQGSQGCTTDEKEPVSTHHNPVLLNVFYHDPPQCATPCAANLKTPEQMPWRQRARCPGPAPMRWRWPCNRSVFSGGGVSAMVRADRSPRASTCGTPPASTSASAARKPAKPGPQAAGRRGGSSRRSSCQ